MTSDIKNAEVVATLTGVFIEEFVVKSLEVTFNATFDVIGIDVKCVVKSLPVIGTVVFGTTSFFTELSLVLGISKVTCLSCLGLFCGDKIDTNFFSFKSVSVLFCSSA